MDKINNGIESLDFRNRPCNCNARMKQNGQCIFDGKCRAQCILYKAACTDCDLTYIGVMQCMFKRQIVEHIFRARGLANENMSALSVHMALRKHWHNLSLNEKLSPDQIRSKLSLEILFQANL
eukprot:13143449-Ditylum_brightwellii.AAC.1